MYNIFGVPRSFLLNSEGDLYTSMYIYDGEIIGHKWLGDHSMEYQENPKNLKIYCSTRRIYWLAFNVNNRPTISTSFFKVYEMVNDRYILIRCAPCHHDKLASYTHLLNNESKIYNNGYLEIYKPGRAVK